MTHQIHYPFLITVKHAMCNMRKSSHKILMVQGVLLALALDLYYQEMILHSLTELTAMIKVSKNEAGIKPKDEVKSGKQKTDCHAPHSY